MTKRRIINPADIKHLGLECPHCKSLVTAEKRSGDEELVAVSCSICEGSEPARQDRKRVDLGEIFRTLQGFSEKGIRFVMPIEEGMGDGPAR